MSPKSKALRPVIIEALEDRQLMAVTPIPFTVFPAIGQGTNFLQNITAGSDGKVYFSSGLANKLESITSGGTVAVYDTTAVAPHGLSGIAIGPDSNMWFVEQFSDAVGKFNVTTKTVSKVAATFPSFSGPMKLIKGPDNNLWSEGFYPNILRITPSGTVTQFKYSGGGSGPLAAFNNKIYFVSNSEIHTISTAGVFGSTVYKPAHSSGILSLVKGPDGKLWFTETSTDATNNYFGTLDTSGAIKEFAVPKTLGDLGQITVGGDGNVYFRAGDNIVGVNTAGTIVRQQNLGGGATAAGAELVAGPDGNLWFNRNFDNQIGVAKVAGSFVGKVTNSVDSKGVSAVRVYADINKNGVYDTGEKSVNTLADGTYRLNLAPGSYTLRYTVPSGFKSVGTASVTATISAGGNVTQNFSVAPVVGLPVIGVVATDNSAQQGIFGSPASTGVIQILREAGSTAAVTIDLVLGGSAVLGTDFNYSIFGGTATYTASTKTLHLTLAAGKTGAAVVITPLTVAAAKPARTVVLTLATSTAYLKDSTKLAATVTIAAT